jgi:arginase family enzyme
LEFEMANFSKQAALQQLAVIGVPCGAGACGIGLELTPSALRSAGLIGHLGRAGFDVTDLGDSEIVPWRPDRANPRAQNIGAIADMVRSTAHRVADALTEPERMVLGLGGDCAVGIGTMAGIRQALGARLRGRARRSHASAAVVSAMPLGTLIAVGAVLVACKS